MNEGGYCWNSGQFAWKAETILTEIGMHLPEATGLLAKIGRAWNTSAREQVLAELYPNMPNGSIDYRVMQKTHNACSILLACRWEDMGTHAALAGRIGEKRGENLVAGKTLVSGKRNIVLANTEQSVVVAADNLIVVITEDTVFVGDRNTDMKTVVEFVAEQEPAQTFEERELNQLHRNMKP
jgi:mannose-1-phosphate guanylyltransferase